MTADPAALTRPTHPRALPAEASGQINWSMWSVIYLKPDAIARRLESVILGWISELLTVSAVTPVTVTREQIFAHYDDMFARVAEIGTDIAAELTPSQDTPQPFTGPNTFDAARLS